MKLYARTNEGSYLNGFKGEGWQEVRTCFRWFPSGRRECVIFPDGFTPKADRCELAQVFTK